MQAGPWAPPIDSAALKAVFAIARPIPGIGHSFGFEWWLGREATTLDFGISIRRTDAKSFAAAACELGRRNRAEGNNTWAEIAALVCHWSERASPLHSWIPYLFLEFDAATPIDPVPVPSVFVSFDWPLGEPDDAIVPGVCRESLKLLLGPRWCPRLDAELSTRLEALPTEGRVIHAGAMLSRSFDTARLSIGLPRDTLRSYLLRIGWPHSTAAAEEALAIYAPASSRVHFE